MTQATVFSQAHKAFRDTPHFRFVQSDPEIRERYRELTRATQLLGNVVGLYVNPPATETEGILIAERGLLMFGSGLSQRIEFSDIDSIQDDRSDIALVLRSGAVVKLHLGEGSSGFGENVRFLRFLGSVLTTEKT